MRHGNIAISIVDSIGQEGIRQIGVITLPIDRARLAVEVGFVRPRLPEADEIEDIAYVRELACHDD